MGTQWTPDIELNLATAATLVRAAFPAFAGARFEPFAFGWDNTAFLADGRVVFRFPRRVVAAALIDREIALLPAIAPALPLAISAPAYHGAASPAFPYAFAGYDRLPGVTACSRPLSPDERGALAAPLGTFLRALHAIDPQPSLARGLRPDELGRLEHAKRAKASHERIQTIVASGLCDDVANFVAWLDAHPATPIADGDRRIVHGDLYARHVLVDDRARITGIIDWGDMHLGDPAIDLSIAHMLLPAHAHAAFRDAYGAIDDRTWRVARYRAIYHAILELDYGIRAPDAGMQRIGSDALALMRAP